MTKKYSTKKALISSILILCMCFSMLVGTTFAWFTDTVTSGNNIIASGNIDVELYHTNSYIANKEKVEGLTDLFTVKEGESFLWEPGAVVWENFEVANEGSLALKYRLLLQVLDASETAPESGKTLADVLKVAVIPGGFNGNREDAKQLAYNYSLETFALQGNIEAGAASDVYGVVIYWEPSSYDNEYNVVDGMTIKIAINRAATQLSSEEDSFGSDYDVGATPSNTDNAVANIGTDGSASMEVDAAPSTNTNKTNITASAGSFNSTDKVEVEVETVNSLFDVNAEGGVVASLDVTMTVNGEKTSADLTDGKFYTVTTYVSKGLANVSVVYTGTDGKSQPTLVSYNAATGELVFTTTHFSNYAVSGSALAYDTKNDVALSTIEQVVAASKLENNSVMIPEGNRDAIEAEIEKLPEEEKEAAVNATAAAKIGDVIYSTFAEAFAAVKDGETIVVLNNVVVSQMFQNKLAITLDLNGKTIACTDTTSKNFSFIDNSGTLSVTGNGTITVSATVNSGWNRYSAVIANNPGGKLIVENGTIEHLGGTDMAYGIDNLTNGKGTYAETVINGGLIKSPYRAVRQFLNGVEADNILTVNGGTLEGANASIFFHDPSTKANTGKLTVSDKASLNGNVYLFVTAGSETWPVKVSIAEAAVKNEVTYKNLPERYVVENKDGVWTVTVDTSVEVSTAEQLREVAANGGHAKLVADISVDDTIVMNGGIIDGNGYTISFTKSGSGSVLFNTTGGTIKNVKIVDPNANMFDSKYAIGSNQFASTTLTEDLYVENVNVSGFKFTIDLNADGNSVYVKNGEIVNWIQVANAEMTTFEGCHLKADAAAQLTYNQPSSMQAIIFLMGNMTFTDCHFEENVNFYLDSARFSGSVYFNNSTYGNNGVENRPIDSFGFIKYWFPATGVYGYAGTFGDTKPAQTHFNWYIDGEQVWDATAI